MVSETKAGILSDRSILKEIEVGNLKITNFEKNCLQGASYDLRLEKAKKDGEILDIAKKGFLVIKPNESIEVETKEEIELPKNISGRVGLRNYFTRKGLYTASDFQIPPGYKGKLTMDLKNLAGIADIFIEYGEPFCTIEFCYAI